MAVKEDLFVTLSTGERAHFSEERLRHSLEHSGAGKQAINEIIAAVKEELYDGIRTRDIYRIAFRMLKNRARHTAARYKLKNAIMELGPSGYPFEQYVGELLKHRGYSVRVGMTMEGSCVSHEVDVVAEDDDSLNIIECKFHNRQGYFCDVKVPLYIRSRFLDIEQKYKADNGGNGKKHYGWIVTNTRFSLDAVKYSDCVGLSLVGWDHPKEGSLKDWVDSSGLHPVTSLTSLTKHEKRRLLDEKIVLCKDLASNVSLLDVIRVGASKRERVLDECRMLCRG